MFTMSRFLRFTSPGLPGAFQDDGVVLGGQGVEGRAGPRQRAASGRACIPRNPCCRRACPMTMTWEPVSLLGLSRTGFIRTSGSMRQAWAWTTCARPISPPSRVTKELSDMFWALNGATRRPSWRRIRQRAAVRMLLPAFEPVPWNMSVGVRCAGRRFWVRFPGPSRRERQRRSFSGAVRTATRKKRSSRPAKLSQTRMAIPFGRRRASSAASPFARCGPGGSWPFPGRRRAPRDRAELLGELVAAAGHEPAGLFGIGPVAERGGACGLGQRVHRALRRWR